MTDLARRVGTDDRARQWQYRWLGPASFPLPWAATGVSYLVFFAIAIPAAAVTFLLLQWAALLVIGPEMLLVYLLTRRITATVTRDQPLRHHAAVLRAELGTARPPAPGQPLRVVRTALDNVVEYDR